MKFTLFIDKQREEEVIVYAREKDGLAADIKRLVSDDTFEPVGYNRGEAVCLDLEDIFCFSVENGRVYAVTEKEKYLIKSRLYRVEENLPRNFVKINQSCIANIKKIKKFDAAISGTLTVIFKNGYTDYVSRRNLKTVKERFGI